MQDRWCGSGSGLTPELPPRADRPGVSREAPACLDGLAAYAGPVMVLYGEHDIFGASTGVVRRRFPQAAQVTLEGSGHLHWLQNQAGYRQALRGFYAAHLRSPV